jgi:hypothetical protein
MLTCCHHNHTPTCPFPPPPLTALPPPPPPPPQDISTKYSELVKAVGRGAISYGERMASVAETDGFLMARDKDQIRDSFPVTEKVREARRAACIAEHWFLQRVCMLCYVGSLGDMCCVS